MKNIFLFCFMFLAAGLIFSLSLEEVVGAETAAELIRAETLTEVQIRKSRPLLAPNHYVTQTFINAAFESIDPVYIVENLYLYTKPAGAVSGNADAWTVAERNALYNGMTAMSTLAGLQYYSASRKRMNTFYETSTVVDGPETGTPQPDPVFQTPPSTLTLYARQKDRRFGENIYQYDYHIRPDALIMVQKNLTDMSSGLIRIIRKGNLRTILAVIDAADYLLIYTVSLIDAPSFPGMKDRIGNSFTNRTTAIVKWLSGQADKAFTPGRY
jgi:hypothetical protein